MAQTTPWSQEDIQLANQYLEWLIEQPDDDQMVNLLWNLYQKHGATEHLIQSLEVQSREQEVVEAPLVYAQLLLKAKREKEAFVLLQKAKERFGGSLTLIKSLIRLSESLELPQAQVEYLSALLALPKLPVHDRVDAQFKLAELHEVLGDVVAAQAAWKALAELPQLTSPQFQKLIQQFLEVQQFDQVLALYERWLKQSPEAETWSLQLERSQIAELKGDAALAERYLLEGKASLLPSHPWYERYLVRWFKFHERRGESEGLEAKLLKQAEAATSELKRQQGWWDLYRFYTWKDDAKQRYQWIEKLAQAAPHEMTYTALWLQLSLDQGKSDLVLGYLSQDFKTLIELHPPLVFMKAQAYLLSQQPGDCEVWLTSGAKLPQLANSVKEQLRDFAKQQGFFAVYEEMLRTQYLERPGDKTIFLELARHYQVQNRKTELEAWVNHYLHEKPAERGLRLGVISEFYGETAKAVDLEKLTREAVVAPDAGREEWLQFVDLLISDGKTEEALTWLERALSKSESLEQVLEIDERIYSVLAGGNSPVDFSQKPTKAIELSSLFTGVGFGEEAKPSDVVEFVPEEIQVYALERVYPFLESRDAFEDAMDQLSEIPYSQLQRELPYVSKTHPLSYFRALWWTARSKFVALSAQVKAMPEYAVLQSQPEFAIPLAKLDLELAIEKEDTSAILAGLETLRRLDPAHALNYDLRWIDVHLTQGGAEHRALAIERLEALTRDQFLDEQVLNLLSQLYFEMGRRDEAMALWKDAIAASQYQNQALLEHFSEILLAQKDATRYWDLLMKTLHREPALEKREDALRRGLDRVAGLFVMQDQSLSPDFVKWLDQLRPQLETMRLKQPLESFWHLALAELHARYRVPGRAYESMKQAYYVQPENIALLKKLKVLAVQNGKVHEALQFQLQYAQAYQDGKSLTEWEEWIALLESNLELLKADAGREMLEQKFAQQQQPLERFVSQYLQTGQPYRARQVLAKLERFAERDPELMWQMSHWYEQAGATEKSMHYAEQWLLRTRDQDEEALGVQFWVREASPQGMVPTWMMESLPRMTQFSEEERQALQAHWSEPRDYLAAEPQTLSSKRLRMIQRWAKGAASLRDPKAVVLPNGIRAGHETTWLAYFRKDETALREGLRVWLQALPFRLEAESVKPWMDWMWLAMESGQGAWMLAALEENSRPNSSRVTLKRWFKGVLLLRAQDANAEWTDDFWNALAEHGELAYQDCLQLMRQFEFRRAYVQALQASKLCMKLAPTVTLEPYLHHAKLYASLGRHDEEKKVLAQALKLPQDTGLKGWSSFDELFQAARRYLELTPNWQEQQAMLSQIREQLLAANRVADAPLRFSRLEGMSGAIDQAAQRAIQAQLREGVTAHAVAPPLMSRLLPGTHREHGEAVDPSTQFSDYWSSGYQWQNTWQQDGLLAMAKAVNAAMDQAFGGVLQGSVTSQEFRRWKIQQLVISLHGEKATKRRALVEAFVAKDSSIEMLSELGVTLESEGYYRECLPFYQQLPLRAPTNNDYSEQFLRATERSWQSKEAVDYLVKLIAAVAELKPNGISRDLMRDQHAMHLARLHRVEDLEELSKQAIAPSRRGTVGRTPEPVAYLRALARLYSRYGEQAISEARWKRLLELVPDDREAILALANAYEARGEIALLTALLKPIQFTTYWDERMRDIFVLKVKLHARKREWSAVERLLKVFSATHAAPQGMWTFQTTPEASELLLAQTYVSVADILAEAGHRSMAQSLLLSRLRACKFDEAKACYALRIMPWLEPKKHVTEVQEMLLLMQRLPMAVWTKDVSLQALAKALESHEDAAIWKQRVLEWNNAPKAQGLLFLALWWQQDAKEMQASTEQDWRRSYRQAKGEALLLLDQLLAAGAQAHVAQLLENLAIEPEQLALRFELASSCQDASAWKTLVDRHGVWLHAQEITTQVRWWRAMGRTEVVSELLEARLAAMKRHGQRDATSVALAVATWLDFGQVARAEAVLMEHSADLIEDLPRLVEKVYKASAPAREPNWEAMNLPDALLQECLLRLHGKPKERMP